MKTTCIRTAFRSSTIIAYVGSIWLANYAVKNWGYDTGTGIHVIPVWPSIDAPSGVLFAGVIFTLRDVVQNTYGKLVSLLCILLGALLSTQVSGDLALASGIAFMSSELLDFGIYTQIAKKSYILAVIVSNTFGLYLDSIMFLTIADIPMSFLSGQVIGKLWMTIAAVTILLIVDKTKVARPS